MNLNQIELLRVLMQAQFNVSKAAAKMHVVQSAVSRQLHLLEGELGSPLFVRNGKKLIGLTLLGERVLAEAETICQAKLNIKAIAADILDDQKGILHVATTHTQAKYFLPKPIAQFRKKYPRVSIYMVQASPEQLIDQLHRHQADIAICTEKVTAEERLVTLPCYDWHHSAVVPKEHPLAEGEVSHERLASYPVLTYSFGFTGRSNIETAFERSGYELDIILAAADTDVIKTYVRLGFGVGLIASMAYDPAQDKDLAVRDLSHLIPRSTTKIAYLKQTYLPLYGQHFVEELLLAAREYGEGRHDESPDWPNGVDGLA